MTTGKALLGVLAGIAAGTAIGMVLASDKGDKTRKNLCKKGADLADAINEKIDQKFEDLLMSVSGKGKKTSAGEQPSSSPEV